ncbi:unnamed protein product [Brassica oleracea var. botrytis]|uniref:Pre-rRNA-processing protein TSR2 n=3 Tax=Brassica TaxID=3705 RepID=A0A0D3E112_BRAOL|nr:PREDICTED: pre-rRNA-processing protein TSR2 homolog [Brassica oleracea var. oleracea]XP_048625641.1 pre-rRNA-processing protein TSR2 homolog [Brassica napus]KAH0856176.1 hypothetical protein HID58_084437 [Brassica napus]CAF1715963.1 unnamed protein product [Brassica napus]VDD28159.1 unnamed protein product [Brassica oleracea]
MESRPSGPVVLTAEEKAVLNEGIGLILSRWTAMRAAVDNGWGGRDSHLKAERTVSNVLDYFIRLKDPTMGFDGLADILESGLNELNTVADDGSLEEVTETLLDLYYECLEGNYQRVEKLRVTSSQTSAKVVKVSNGNDEDGDDEESDDEDDDDEDTQMSNDQSTDMMVDAAEDCSNGKPEAMPVDEPKADDGWTVVPSRKNKGKRN